MGNTGLPQAWTPIASRDVGGSWEETTRHGIVTLATAPAYELMGHIETCIKRSGRREVWFIRAVARRGRAA